MDTQELKENAGQRQLWLNKEDDVMDKQKLKEIIERHQLWLNGEPGGERADLKGAYLKGTDLRGAYLSGADLSDANLSGANLSYAYLSSVNLGDADLRGAYLKGTDLSYAYLRGAYLSGADLSGVNLGDADLRDAYLKGTDLSYAYLRGAYLSGADLRRADLSDADLRGANLKGTDLRGADLRGANLSDATNVLPIACPEKESFVGFKKALGPDNLEVIVEIQILKNAKRSSATTRKCRCSEAKVLSITTIDGEPMDIVAHSKHDKTFTYKVDEFIKVDDFDDNRWNECAAGIHFFITRNEAVNWNL